MSENSTIEWTDHTFNPWIGCTKITGSCEGSACDHCYAETMAHRYGWATWGPGEPRARTSAEYWKKPLVWNRRAAKEGRRYRVFCASLADVFDAEVLQEWRGDLFELIEQTPNLDWQLLTKRPQVALKFFSDRPDLQGLQHVWLGTTVENQKMADLRIPTLLKVPGIAKRFLSCEPLLGPIDLTRCGVHYTRSGPLHLWHTDLKGNGGWRKQFGEPLPEIDWVIAGGESGPAARPSHPDWFRSLRDQCAAAGVPFFFKQWGEFVPCEIALNKAGRLSVVASDGEHLTGSRAVTGKPGDKGAEIIARVGKKAAGAELDGKLHREFPL